MSEPSILVTWRHNKEKWFLFTNNQFKPKKKSTDDFHKDLKKSSKSKFYFTSRKPETKGTIVYTPSGYGIIQDIKSINEPIPIKLNISGKIQEFDQKHILFDIPIIITFMSSSFKGEDTLTIPLTVNAKDIVTKIESSFIGDGESIINVQVFFKGRDLQLQSNFSLEKLGVVPNSRFLAVPEVGIPFTLSRFNNVYEGWGYSDKCINAISFTTSKSVKIRGFGVYTPDNSYSDGRSFSSLMKFIRGIDDSGQILFTKEIVVQKTDSVENKIFKFFFDRPIRIKSGESYTCVQEAIGNYNCYTYYGDSGQSEMVGEKDVVFSFAECYTNTNNTNKSCGQIPEIYYYA